MPFKSAKTPPRHPKPVLIKVKGEIQPCVYMYDNDDLIGKMFNPYRSESLLYGIHIDDVDAWIYLDDVG